MDAQALIERYAQEGWPAEVVLMILRGRRPHEAVWLYKQKQEGR